jgi:protein-S-isoprenylcysteine O-methyltransferase Ste14
VSDPPAIPRPSPAGPSPIGSWRYRRRIIHAVLAWCAVFVPVMTWRYPESAIVSQAVIAAIGLAGGTVGSYVFGAVWDDNNSRKSAR